MRAPGDLTVRVPEAAGELPTPPREHPEEPAAENELFMHLEPDQFVVETSRPVMRARLNRRAIAALWALRVFAVAVSAMVIYTFVSQLH